MTHQRDQEDLRHELDAALARIAALEHELASFRRTKDDWDTLESRLQATQKLQSLGVLAGGVAHDFNNLLTGILGSASLASMKVPETSPAQEQLKRTLEAAEKAAELTQQMLSYAGTGPVVRGELDLNDAVQEVVPLVRTSISKRINFSQSFADNLPRIEGDKSQLQQVAVNLIINASEALEGNDGEVRIRTGALEGIGAVDGPRPGAEFDGPHVFLEVSDTGVGMDEDTRRKVFDPFFTTKLAGRGLGLAAAQGIVRACDGTIRVVSRPQRGSTFTVLLPASRKPPSPIVDDP